MADNEPLILETRTEEETDDLGQLWDNIAKVDNFVVYAVERIDRLEKENAALRAQIETLLQRK